MVIWWFRSHALYCPSVIYPPDTHSLINVLSDLLNLFSFLLTVILFPLDWLDSVCVCMCVPVCVDVYASVSAYWSAGEERKQGLYPERFNLISLYCKWPLSVPCLNEQTIEQVEELKEPLIAELTIHLLCIYIGLGRVKVATGQSRVNIGRGLAGLPCQINICK